MNEPQYEVDQTIPITVYREESNFDRACDSAYRQACRLFRVDDGGHLTNVRNAPRSECSIVVEFLRLRHFGGYNGHNVVYDFEAKVECSNHDKEDDQ